jgi:predicted Rdx family selenoprotein
VEPALVEGGRGEFTVWVDEEVVARKDSGGFPSEDHILTAVQQATRVKS